MALLDAKPVSSILSSAGRERVAAAVATAEARTSAEIAIVITPYCWGDIHHKAARLFRKHGLHQTRRHNAVMIMVVTKNREFLIYGDRGINALVGPDYWWDVRDELAEFLQRGQAADGLIAAVARIGEKLATHFPKGNDDTNEVADDVILDG